MKTIGFMAAVVVLCAVPAGILLGNSASDGEGFCITVSPSTIVLSSPDTTVSVHSNIPYGIVDKSSLTLNGIEPSGTKVDNLGCLVVKFDKADIKQIVTPGKATLTLSGLLTDGTAFEASDTVTVR
jgi:hypothetical protein